MGYARGCPKGSSVVLEADRPSATDALSPPFERPSVALKGVTLLDATQCGAAVDAAHIAIDVAKRIHYLAAWNFRPIGNAAMRSRIEQVCRAAGYGAPVICTSNELVEIHHGDP